MSLNDTDTKLADLGWTPFFIQQLELEELETLTPARISEVRRTTLAALTANGPHELITPPDMLTSDLAVGDWVLVRPDGRIERQLERNTLITRRAAGHDARSQLIAANVDVLFITSSCNADFNPARLERYLVLAASAGCTPVLVLTKADQADPTPYIEAAEQLQPGIAVIALNAKDPNAAEDLFNEWPPGRTAALLGSSGVGKSTLTNAFTESSGDTRTAAIREDDAKGRHTTTTRNLYSARGNRWIIDTPGMRELQLLDAGEGIDAVFADLEELAANCKFRDCGHESEPGCAVRAAIDDGAITQERLRRWQKLAREDALNTETVQEARIRGKALTRFHKRTQSEARAAKGGRKSKR